MKFKSLLVLSMFIILTKTNNFAQSILLKNWFEYIAEKPTSGKKPVEIAELIFYVLDKKGQYVEEISRPNIINPIGFEKIVNNEILLNFDKKKLVTKKNEKIKDHMGITALKEVRLVAYNSEMVMPFGKDEVKVQLEDMLDKCIGKFSLDGIQYAVEITMKKAILDSSGKLIFI